MFEFVFHFRLYVKIPLSKSTVELSFDAIPILEFDAQILFKISLDFSPTDKALSPHSLRLSFSIS